MTSMFAFTQVLGLTTAEILVYGVLAILLVVIAVSVRVVVECVRKQYANPILMAVLMFGSSIGSLFFILLTAAGFIPQFERSILVPIAGVVVWFASLILYAGVSSSKKRREETDDRADWQRELDAGAVVPYDIKQLPDEPEDTEATPIPNEPVDADVTPIQPNEPVAAGESTGPRRAVSLPAAESDRNLRPSEQTLKRVTAAQIEADAKLKGPRASEVPGNPILPDGEVKIRCLACDKKMKADAGKFRKQRRCPACKAEPFRYVTAV